MTGLIPLAEALTDAEVFTDGDWVESKDQDPDGDVRLTQLADVGDGGWINKSARFLTSEKAKQLRCTYLKPGDLLVARMPDPLGRCCVFPGDAMPCVTVVDVCVIRPNQQKIDNRYLMRVINSPEGRQGITRHITGTTRQRISRKNLAKLQIPLPPLPEQKRIAAILDVADTLRAKRRESLAQLDTLLQSTFLDMFGDPVTNPMGWDKQRIDEVFDVARGGSPRPIQDYLTDSEDGLNWIMIGDATAESRYITKTKNRIRKEGLKKTRSVNPGDFLLTNSMSFGKPYILKTAGCIHDGWLVLSPKDKRMVPDYFYSLLSTEALYREFSRRAAGAVVKNLNTKLVSQVSVAVPPFALQAHFRSLVESVERQKARLRTHLAELDTLFASLQSRAFNGQL